MKSSHPLSLSDLEMELDSVDKSSISRTLANFKKNHLIHSFNDGSGSMKYELCNSAEEDIHDDLHVHFRCEKCGNTICLTSISIPEVKLPEGFYAHEMSYIVSGICAECSESSCTLK